MNAGRPPERNQCLSQVGASNQYLSHFPSAIISQSSHVDSDLASSLATRLPASHLMTQSRGVLPREAEGLACH
jgi:hypothetical protein